MAANSNVEIANMALQIVAAKPIASFTEGTKFATMIDSLFDTERDATLRAYDWNFASKRATLAKLQTAPVFGFSSAFQLPSDVVRVLETFPRTTFKIEGRQLLCDADSVAIRYTRRVTNPADWDDMFKSAFAARLAMKIAYTATELAGMVDRAVAAYKDALGEARTADAQEGSQEIATSPEADVLIDVRRTGGSGEWWREGKWA